MAVEGRKEHSQTANTQNNKIEVQIVINKKGIIVTLFFSFVSEDASPQK